jgi:hypothetical protein
MWGLASSSILVTEPVLSVRQTKGEFKMTNATLFHFRAIAKSMNAEPTDWQWIGQHLSQRMFGITEARAKAYASRHGGVASKMPLTLNCEDKHGSSYSDSPHRA